MREDALTGIAAATNPTSSSDLLTLLFCYVPVVIVQVLFLRPTTLAFLDRDHARVSGVRVVFWELLYFYCLGLAVAAASKVTGSLLVFAYLLLPPMTSLLFMRRLLPTLLLSAALAEVATFLGLCLSVRYDLPANQLVCVLLLGLLCAAAACAQVKRIVWRLRRA